MTSSDDGSPSNPLLVTLVTATHVRKRTGRFDVDASLNHQPTSTTPTRALAAVATATAITSTSTGVTQLSDHEPEDVRSLISHGNSSHRNGSHGNHRNERLDRRPDDDSAWDWSRCCRSRRMGTASFECGATLARLLPTVLPCWSWLHVYPWRSHLVSDLVAGITVGVMIVPQSMSYAKLAGLPVQWGLYSSLTPVFVYALYGTSRQLAVGPVALISLLLSTGLTNVLQPSALDESSPEYQQQYQRLALHCSALAGALYLVAGLGRWGRVITMFLSHAVISGFTTGAAIIIGLSQVKYLVGYDVGKSDKVPDVLMQLFRGIDQFNYKTFVMGTASIALLVGTKYVANHWPQCAGLRPLGPLLVTVAAIVLTVLLDLSHHGIPVVGPIPRGFPRCTVHEWWPVPTANHVTYSTTSLLSVVASMAVIGFMESIAIAKQLAAKHGYDIDASKELIGLGMANVAGSAFNAFPIAGSFSRTAVNNASGATSALAGLATATLVCITLLCLTFVFERLPLNSLAAIVIAGVMGLVDTDEAIHLYKVHKIDFATWCLACGGTMLLGCEVGLGIAVLVSVLIVVYQSAQPDVTIVDRMPLDSPLDPSGVEPDELPLTGTIIVRVAGSLFFANQQTIDDVVQQHATNSSEPNHAGIQHVILDLSAVNHIDSSGIHQIEKLLATCRTREQEFYLVAAPSRIMTQIVGSGLAATIGSRCITESIPVAVSLCAPTVESA